MVVLFEGIPDLFLMIHDFLLLVLEKGSFVYPEEEGRGEVLAVSIELWVGLFWRQGVSLKLGTELHLYIIFARVGS